MDKETYLADLKSRFANEDGAIDVEKLLDAKAEADLTLMGRETEMDELRQDLTTRATLEQVLARLEQRQTPDVSNSGNNPSEQNGPKEIAQREVEAFIAAALEKEKQKDTQARNRQEADAELSKVWGATATTKIAAKAQELGVSKEFLDELKASQPKAFLRLVLAGEQPKQDPSAVLPPRSTATLTSGNQVKDYAYWQRVRKENPSFYHSIEGVRERHKMAEILGDSFYKD